MGNYFATYKDHSRLHEKNNNKMNTLPSLVKTAMTDQPASPTKLSRLVQIVTAEITVENLYNSFRDKRSSSFKAAAWDKFGNLHNLFEDSSSSKKRIDTQLQKCQNTKLSTSENEDIDKESITIRNQQNFSTHFAPLISDNTLKRINKLQKLPRKHIETNLFVNFTSVINMVDLYQPSNNIFKRPMQDHSYDSVFYTGTDCCINKYPRGVSFFVDLNEPSQRYPLRKEHRFNWYNHDCWSDSDQESLCSFKCHENDVCDDFIVFNENEFDEDNFCEFYVSMNSRKDPLFSVNCKNTTKSAKPMHTGTNIDEVSDLSSEECQQACEARARKCDQNSKNSNKNPRKVRFETGENLEVVYHMKHWDFAYREARKGPWELAAVDRFRFCRRIQDLESIITPCLQRKLQAIDNV